MNVAQQLHASSTHKTGLDPSCPVCNPLIAIIRDLERCARQNEKDAKWSNPLDREARAVAAEQRRIIKLLKAVRFKENQ
jgi:hypothetical protein